MSQLAVCTFGISVLPRTFPNWQPFEYSRDLDASGGGGIICDIVWENIMVQGL